MAELPEPWPQRRATNAAASAARAFGARVNRSGVFPLTTGGTSYLYTVEGTDWVLRVVPPSLNLEHLQTTMTVLDHWHRIGYDLAPPFTAEIGSQIHAHEDGFVSAWRYLPQSDVLAGWADVAKVHTELLAAPLPSSVSPENWRWNPHGCIPARVARYLASPHANHEWARYVMDGIEKWQTVFGRLMSNEFQADTAGDVIGPVHGDLSPQNLLRGKRLHLGDWDDVGFGLLSVDRDRLASNTGQPFGLNEGRPAQQYLRSSRQGDVNDYGTVAWLLSCAAVDPFGDLAARLNRTMATLDSNLSRGDVYSIAR